MEKMTKEGMDRINTKEWKNFNFARWLKFLAEAVPAQAIGETQSFIKHEGDLWEATDGHRLHRVLSDEIPHMQDGYYEVMKNTKAETILIKAGRQDVNWPDTEVVWPKHKDFVEITGNQSWMYTDLVRKLPEDRTLQYQYVNCLFDFDEFWTAYIYNDDLIEVIKFEADPMVALIMPMRMRKEG